MQLSQRAQVIAAILERLDEFADPLNGPAGVTGDGESSGFMPCTYSPSVREVERLYKQLRAQQPNVHWHVAEWYVRPTSKVAMTPKLTKRHGKTVQVLNADRTPVYTRNVITRRNPKANQAQANQGVTWIADHWTPTTEPMLPCLCGRREGQPHDAYCQSARRAA